jgi:hypothetical protein
LYSQSLLYLSNIFKLDHPLPSSSSLPLSSLPHTIEIPLSSRPPYTFSTHRCEVGSGGADLFKYKGVTLSKRRSKNQIVVMTTAILFLLSSTKALFRRVNTRQAWNTPSTYYVHTSEYFTSVYSISICSLSEENVGHVAQRSRDHMSCCWPRAGYVGRKIPSSAIKEEGTKIGDALVASGRSFLPPLARCLFPSLPHSIEIPLPSSPLYLWRRSRIRRGRTCRPILLGGGGGGEETL